MYTYIYLFIYNVLESLTDKYTSYQLREHRCNLHLQLHFLLFIISCAFILQWLIRG